MRILWKYLRPLRWWVALSLLLAGLAQTLALIGALATLATWRGSMFFYNA